MALFNKTQYQKNQISIISKIANQSQSGKVSFSTVSAVSDYKDDKRICLTTIHFIKKDFKEIITEKIINPFKKLFPNNFYYLPDSLHITIKNIRVVADPPNFSDLEINKVTKILEQVSLTHKRYRAYFFRFIIFSNNLSLIGTTDEESDKLVLDFDKKLNENGVADDKNYFYNKFFFVNISLLRFYEKPSALFKQKIVKLSEEIIFPPYLIDSLSLVKGNAVMSKKEILGHWRLRV